MRFPLSEKKTLLALCVIISVLALLWGVAALASDGTGPTDTTWQEIEDTGVMLVGIDVAFPPFGGYSEAQGVYGIDADLARALAAELGVEVRFVSVNFDGMYDTLYTGDVDILIAALRADPRRLDRFRYTDAYFDGGYSLVGVPPVPDDLRSIEQSVAVSYASEGDVVAQEILARGEADFEIQQLLSIDAVIEALLQRDVSLALLDRVSAYEALQQDPDLALSPSLITSDSYVVAVRRTDWRLYSELQNALSDLEADGRLQGILNRWLLALQVTDGVEQ